MHLANVTIRNPNGLNWHAIDWRDANQRVNNLRQRIYRASVEGNMKRIRNLQKLMIRSFANKVVSIRRVTQENQGRKTPGIDKIVVETDKEREALFQQLQQNHIRNVHPVKRVYIPKKNGQRRPLGIPAIIDRCWQAIVKSALEPFWESKFELSSYGFRPGRGCHDAIQKIFCIARVGKSRKWVLDADIKGAFDNIDHAFLLQRIGNFPAREMIKRWLKAGVIEKGTYTSTMSGTPQGGIISPLLANIAFHGLEELLSVKYDYLGRLDKKSKFAVVRYADDFLVFAQSRDDCEHAKSKIKDWLSERGLAFSEEKTSIKHMTEGIDFLGFTVRHYPTRGKRRGAVFLAKPSRNSIRSHKQQMRQVWKMVLSWPINEAINILNQKVKGWVNYFRIGTSKKTFSKMDDWMWIRQRRFVERRHPNKYWWWLRKQYWGSVRWRKDKWVLMDKKSGVYLWKHAWTPIKRHTLVKGNASPDDPTLRSYWEQRRTRNKWYDGSLSRAWMYKKQGEICPLCSQNLDNKEELHIHHIIPKSEGGKDDRQNLVLLHAACHRQLHSKQGKSAEVHKLLEPYAG